MSETISKNGAGDAGDTECDRSLIPWAPAVLSGSLTRVGEGSGVRAERAGLFQLVDAAGAPLPLKPGRTWFEFVPLDAGVSFTAATSGWAVTAPVLPEQTPPRP